MRIAILDCFISRYLQALYGSTPSLQQASYAEQIVARSENFVGLGDAYSRNFHALGHEAHVFSANNPWIQAAWAREHGMQYVPPASIESITARQDRTAWIRRTLQPLRSVLYPLGTKLGLGFRLDDQALRILRAQVEDFAPDVVLNQSIVLIGHEFIRSIRKPGRTIIAQHGVAPPVGVDYSVYDFAITMLPYVVEHFRSAGLPAEQVHLAFDAAILEHVPTPKEKDLDISFVGGIEAQYDHRIRLIEAICERYPVHLFLSGSAGLPESSPIEKHRQKGVWGRDMFRILQRSRLTLNTHINAARGFAGNMRLFEATGVGTCLLTDNQSNLSSLFTPNQEVIAYTSIEDCVAKIGLLLDDDSRMRDIAAAGQKRTLASHTYLQRVQQILRYIARYGR